MANIISGNNQEFNDEPVGGTAYYRILRFKKKKQFYFKLSLLFLVFNLFLIIQAFSQLVTVNNSIIANTTGITVKGDVSANAGAVIYNTDTISITGDLENNSGGSLFGNTSGTVMLNGGIQEVKGNSVTHFGTLVTSGSGSKVMLQDVITDALQLESSHLDLNSHTLTVNSPIPAGISRNSGFIISETDYAQGYGNVAWKIAEGTGTFIFPFGNASSSSYMPVTLAISAPGSGAGGSVKISTYPTLTTAAPNNRPLPDGLSSLMGLSGTENAHHVADRWWVIESNDYFSNPVASGIFSYRDSEWDVTGGSTNQISETMLQAQSTDGATWSLPSGSANIAANTVSVPAINFSNRLWSLVSSDTPLPIELLYFDAQLNEKRTADILWVTATETNNDFFTIEKSHDGVSFVALEVVDGAGNSSHQVRYYFEDKNPFNGNTYYRLKQTDFDGKFSYSAIRVINMDNVEEDAISVFPNPATDYIFIKGKLGERVMVSDAQGKTVIDVSPVNEDAGKNVIRLDLSGLSQGIYFLMTGNGKSEKLVIR